MPPLARVRAPQTNGAVLALPPIDEAPALVAANQRRFAACDRSIDGLPLPELRLLARNEALALAGAEGTYPIDAPLLLTGHQPEMFHPGVWVKNFALNGLARRVAGIPLNLIVDHDTMKSANIALPTWDEWKPTSVRLDHVAFDKFDGEQPYEQRKIRDGGQFASFAERVLEQTRQWGYEPLLLSSRERERPEVHLAGSWVNTIGERFTSDRIAMERAWGCRNLELRVSQLCGTASFAHFVNEIVRHATCFRECHNSAVRAYRQRHGLHSRTHPVPELTQGELPFWEMTATGRKPLTQPTTTVNIRPRALTLTLFARICLGDFFIHGIGGGKYDEVTDQICRDFFGIEPPAFQVLTATVHLPLPGFPGTETDVRYLERQARDLHWNPQRHTTAGEAYRQAKAALAAIEPQDHTARRKWFRQLSSATDKLRPLVSDQLEEVRLKLDVAREEAAANTILRRRDYAWVLYSESTLRPMMEQFL